MTKKIVELVQEKDFITLKSILEEKVAYKIKEKIDAKKEEFKEKAKSLYGRKPLTETIWVVLYHLEKITKLW